MTKNGTVMAHLFDEIIQLLRLAPPSKNTVDRVSKPYMQVCYRLL